MYTVKKTEGIVYDARYPKDCLIDLWMPETDSPVPLFLYFHGGGLEAGKRTDAPLMDMVTHWGIAVATADYRMYPGAKYPEFLEDAAACVRFMKEYKEAAFSGIFVGGSSAGGYISMMLCFAPQFLAAVGMKPTDIAGYVHDAGQPTVHFNVLRERGMDSRSIRVDEACPIYYTDHTPDPADVPPMIFFYADNDMPCRPEQTEMFYATLKYLRYPMDRIHIKRFDGFNHCGYNFQNNTEGFNILSAESAAFILKYSK
ncbi:MAG: alpha/beta hydrolase [Clostridia bacterium]|nr:alpha/beta hydrolase [Clostridia bacterium]